MKLSAITDGITLTLLLEEFILEQVPLKHGSVFVSVIGEKRYEIQIESHHNGKLLSQPLLFFYPINEIKKLKVEYVKETTTSRKSIKAMEKSKRRKSSR